MTDNIKVISHAEMVMVLCKSGNVIAEELTGSEAHTIHMMMGVCGEAGEIKKSVIYRKPLDRDNVIEELGDLEFYMEGLRQGLGITREETLAGNIAKLSKRYEGMSYSDNAAKTRADKS